MVLQWGYVWMFCTYKKWRFWVQSALRAIRVGHILSCWKIAKDIGTKWDTCKYSVVQRFDVVSIKWACHSLQSTVTVLLQQKISIWSIQIKTKWRICGERKKLRKELIFLTKMERIKLKTYLRIQFLRFSLQTKEIFKAHLTS